MIETKAHIELSLHHLETIQHDIRIDAQVVDIKYRLKILESQVDKLIKEEK